MESLGKEGDYEEEDCSGALDDVYGGGGGREDQGGDLGEWGVVKGER